MLISRIAINLSFGRSLLPALRQLSADVITEVLKYYVACVNLMTRHEGKSFVPPWLLKIAVEKENFKNFKFISRT